MLSDEEFAQIEEAAKDNAMFPALACGAFHYLIVLAKHGQAAEAQNQRLRLLVAVLRPYLESMKEKALDSNPGLFYQLAELLAQLDAEVSSA